MHCYMGELGRVCSLIMADLEESHAALFAHRMVASAWTNRMDNIASFLSYQPDLMQPKKAWGCTLQAHMWMVAVCMSVFMLACAHLCNPSDAGQHVDHKSAS